MYATPAMDRLNARLDGPALAQLARDRIATCDRHLSCNTLKSHSWIAVSSLCNGRGAYCTTVDGQPRDAVGMFPGQSPTLLTERNCREVCAAFNEQFASDGNDERLRPMVDRDWWAREKRDAESILALLAERTA